MEISGTIIAVLPIESGQSQNGNTWQRQTFAITTGGEYPNTIAFQISSAKIQEFGHQLAPGAVVNVKFTPKSREYQSKYYTQLDAWGLEVKSPGVTASAPVDDLDAILGPAK